MVAPDNVFSVNPTSASSRSIRSPTSFHTQLARIQFLLVVQSVAAGELGERARGLRQSGRVS